MSFILILAGAAPVWALDPVKGPVTLILAGCCDDCATTSLALSASATDTSDARSLMILLLRRFQREPWVGRSRKG